METNLVVKVEKVNGILITTSKRVAEELGVRHGDLLEKIDNYVKKFSSTESSAQFYIASSYKDRSGKLNRNYLITEKGIAQLIGGYSSAVTKAFDLNVAYINEFEKMKNTIYNTQYIKKLEDKTPMEQFKDNVVALNEAFNVLGLNIPKELIGSTAITTTQKATGYDFEEVKLLLNKQDEEQYHSASGLLGRLGVKRNRTNETLVLLGLQTKGTTTMQPYALTELGKEYGVERTYTNKGHQGYEIKWKEALLDFVKDNFENIPKEFIK